VGLTGLDALSAAVLLISLLLHIPNDLHTYCRDLLWSSQGSDEEKAEAAAVLVAVLEAMRLVAVGLSPITPGLSARILAQLGYSEAEMEASDHFCGRGRGVTLEGP
jgi:methionyl-tRNA synthetase